MLSRRSRTQSASMSHDTFDERRRRHRRSGVPLLLLGMWLAVACDGRSPTAPPDPDPDPPDGSLFQRVEIVSGDSQTGRTGEMLFAPMVVRVTKSSSGMPAVGVTVFWDVVRGGGELEPMNNNNFDAEATTKTDSNGLTDVGLILGPQPGVNEVRAWTIFGTEAVTFVATGTSP